MWLSGAMRNVAGGVMMAAMVGGWGGGVTVIEAQARPVAARSDQNTQRAEDTRREFRQLLDQFPPALGVVLKSDPTLLSNATYLASYPALAEYLAGHPDVPRDPTYFLEHVQLRRDTDEYGRVLLAPDAQVKREAINMWRDTTSGFMFLLGFATAAFCLLWIIRYVVEHRRWLRATRIQSDAHNKLLERFSSSAELAAYMESPAGAQFLQAAPLSLESSSRRAPGAPFSRILWSAQAGVVLIAAGIGFLVIQRQMIEEVAQMLGAWGIFSIAVGVGFVISAAASYVISSRMGLLGEPKA